MYFQREKQKFTVDDTVEETINNNLFNELITNE